VKTQSTFTLTLKDTGDAGTATPRLRKLLKLALRTCGYRCTSIAEVARTVQTATAATSGREKPHARIPSQSPRRLAPDPALR
jgi:hypothetical protein